MMQFMILKPLAMFCGCTARFVLDLVGNPKDRFSLMRLIITLITFISLQKDCPDYNTDSSWPRSGSKSTTKAIMGCVTTGIFSMPHGVSNGSHCRPLFVGLSLDMGSYVRVRKPSYMYFFGSKIGF